MPRKGSDVAAAAVALMTGIGAWEMVRQLGQRQEAWDSPLYWQVGYPLMLMVAAVLGFTWRERPWRWVIVMMGAQAAWSLVTTLASGGSAGLFPLGLAMFAILGLPCLLGAYIAKWIGDRVIADT